MADSEVSRAYIESLLRLVKTARRIDAEQQAWNYSVDAYHC